MARLLLALACLWCVAADLSARVAEMEKKKGKERSAQDTYAKPPGTPAATHVHNFEEMQIAALAHFVTKCFSTDQLSEWNSCLRSEMKQDMVSVWIFEGNNYSSWMHCKSTVVFNWGDYHVQICTV
ncbi:unnamed protein product [Durusdinium trenchii]|uniref:Uncharacterized protein n=1 Tax=Durusdinium trenchii TaxID=1381693 RepID=A0ABP0I7J8_9DINO